MDKTNDNLKYKIMLEISNHCEMCPLREKCIEMSCVLFRIEKLIIGDSYEKQRKSKYVK